MNTRMARAAAAAGGLAIAAAFAVSCAATKEATKDAASSASSIGSSAASAAGSAASSAVSSGASAASSAVSSGASAASSVVSSVLNGTPTTLNVPGIGEVSLDGPAAGAYARLGGATALGAPTAAAEKVGDGSVLAFANGSIYESPAGAYVVQGEILKHYVEQGGPAGELGWPTADEKETGGGPKVASGGWISEFQNGSITWLNDGKGTFSETVTKK